MELVVLIVAVVAAIGGAVTAVAVRSKREYDAGNEVVPWVATRAPSSWAGAHSAEAVLHRRLRGAVVAVRAARFAGLGDAQSVVEHEALAIDDRLIAAAALPASHRDSAIGALSPVVAALEAAVASMTIPVDQAKAGAAVPGLPALDSAVAEVRERLDALAAARAELDRLDAPFGVPGAAPRDARTFEQGT